VYFYTALQTRLEKLTTSDTQGMHARINYKEKKRKEKYNEVPTHPSITACAQHSIFILRA